MSECARGSVSRPCEIDQTIQRWSRRSNPKTLARNASLQCKFARKYELRRMGPNQFVPPTHVRRYVSWAEHQGLQPYRATEIFLTNWTPLDRMHGIPGFRTSFSFRAPDFELLCPTGRSTFAYGYTGFSSYIYAFSSVTNCSVLH